MAGVWGKCDFAELKAFRDKLEKVASKQSMEIFTEKCAKELAARLWREVRKMTPVGVYPKGSGMTGGTLRRGWKVGAVKKSGDTITVELINPIFYTSYVEYGHRTANHAGWVSGHFMLTKSEKRIREIAPALLEKKLNQYLAEGLR